MPPPCVALCVTPCAQAHGTQASMKPAAILSLLLYTAGLPLSFLAILVRYRSQISADQSLRQRNLGDSPATNPNFYIRLRFQELYV